MIRNFSRVVVIRTGVIALAAAALTLSSAQASVILNPPGSGVQVNATLPISVVSSDLTTSQVVNGDVTGPKIYGEAVFSSPDPRIITEGQVYNIAISSTGNASGIFQSSSVPVSWDFTIAENFNVGGESSLTWTLTYTLNEFSVCSEGVFTACTASVPLSFQTTGSGFGEFNGTGSISGLTGVTANNWSVDLDISWQPIGTTGPYSLTVTAPQNSIDFPAASIPEPGTSALLGAGLAALAFLRRTRRK